MDVEVGYIRAPRGGWLAHAIDTNVIAWGRTIVESQRSLRRKIGDESANFIGEAILPEDIVSLRDRRRALLEQLHDISASIETATDELVHKLMREQLFSHRDAAYVLGLSAARICQIMAASAKGIGRDRRASSTRLAKIYRKKKRKTRISRKL